jgi:hypothetical protein
MYLIEPGILADASGLSIGLSVGGLILGLALWLLGWRWHRFWVGLGITLLGGVYGLHEAAAFRAHPLVAGVLLALGAGVLSLALARVLAFAAGGCAAALAVQAFVPTWDQPLVSFITGGLLGVLLYRLWVMTLTSLGGALLMVCSSLLLIERLGKLNSADFADRHPILLNWICGSLAALGLILQLLLNRRAPGSRGAGQSKDRDRTAEARPSKSDRHDSAGRKGWLDWVPWPLRKAA